MLQKLIFIALAGGLGTLARYGLAGLAQRWAGSGFPWGTLTVNALGCFLFGIIWVLASQRLALSPEIRVIVLVGFMGAFTTFSTYVFETGQMLENSQWLLAGGNILLHNAVGLALFFAGAALARWA